MANFTPDPIISTIKHRIRTARESRGLENNEAADSCGVARSQYWEWENKRNVMPTAYSLRRICEGLNVSADYLLGLVDEDAR